MARVGAGFAAAAVLATLSAAVATAQTPVTTTPVTPTPPVVAPLPEGMVAQGVSIAGVPVGGLYRIEAKKAILAQVVAPKRLPILVIFRGKRLVFEPAKAGYGADVDYAVKAALLFGRKRPVPARGIDIPLRETVSGARLNSLLTLRTRKLVIPSRDASRTWNGVIPTYRPGQVSVSFDRKAAIKMLREAILTRARPTYTIPVQRVKPAVTDVGPAITIERGKFRLTLWRGNGTKRSFPIALGMPGHSTPTGSYSIIQKQRNPTWFPPDSPWAEGLGPVPPGVSNPLGTRWMGTSAPAIGIHGTPISSSIGTAASHGCIRMYIHDAEYLYDQISIGTPVIIR